MTASKLVEADPFLRGIVPVCCWDVQQLRKTHFNFPHSCTLATVSSFLLHLSLPAFLTSTVPTPLPLPTPRKLLSPSPTHIRLAPLVLMQCLTVGVGRLTHPDDDHTSVFPFQVGGGAGVSVFAHLLREETISLTRVSGAVGFILRRRPAVLVS